MVTKTIFLTYINQIATLFCDNDVLCKAGIIERIKQNFTDDNFPIFLANINSKRFWYLNSVQYQPAGTKIKMTMKLTDIITNYESTVIVYGFPPAPQVAISKFGGQIISATPKFIIMKTTATKYGITFVPVSVPGNNPPLIPGGNVLPTPAYSPPIVGTPVQQSGGGEEILSFLTNPIVIIGLGVGAYFLFKK